MALKVKTPEQAQAQIEFINEVNRNQLQEQESIWSLDGLNKLEPDELVARLDAVESQSYLIKWRILWALRQKFASDKLFGQYLNDIRDSSAPEWLSSPRDISRSIAAGRFCEQHGINNLRDAAIYKGSIYALSVMDDGKEAKRILAQIKKKNIAVNEVYRLIEQTKAVATIEKAEVMDYDRVPTPLKVVTVENNAVVEPKTEQAIESPVEVIVEPLRAILEPAEEVITHVEPLHTLTRRQELLQELALMDASGLTTDEQADEIMMLVESYRLSFIRQIPVFQLCIKKAQVAGYK